MLPLIVATRQVAQTDRFTMKTSVVRFSNGVDRLVERIETRSGPTVLIVPLLDVRTVLLVREYCAGTHTYEIGFPAGTVGSGESLEEAADRELKEEVGFGARHVSRLMTVQVLPGHFDHETHLLLAENLYPEKLEGDEPEELEVVRCPVVDLQRLREAGVLREARTLAASLLLEQFLRQGGHGFGN
jgi:ADP-ribose diphosphatase